MKKIWVIAAIFLIACNNEGENNTVKMGDSNVLGPVNDTVQFSDTDDYNKPSSESNPLDAPPDFIGDSLDGSKQVKPKRN